jgi:hypothetical protein
MKIIATEQIFLLNYKLSWLENNQVNLYEFFFPWDIISN